MGSDQPGADGWILREASTSDIAELMKWFESPRDVSLWGGPRFRYPYNRASFFEDIHWGRILSFSLCNPDHELVGFGQVYDREKHVHLARLIVVPAYRGHGTGKRLIRLLMRAGREKLKYDRYSLFVYRDNLPAYGCYKSLGFEVSDYPKNMPYGDVCYYLTRNGQEEES